MGSLRKRTALGVALALFVCRVPLPVTVALAEDMNEPTVIVQGVREGETSSVPVDSHYESTIPTEAPGEDGAPTEGSPETADPVVEDSAEEGPSGTSEAPEPGPSGDPAGGEGGVVPSPDDAVEDDDTGSVSSEGSAQSREDVLESEGTAVSAEESTEVTPLSAAPAAEAKPSVTYRAHVSNIGWMSPVKDGVISGTTGRNLGMESLEVSLGTGLPANAVEIRPHIRNLGWQGWSTGRAGTTGRALPIEALQIRLTGEAAQKYDIWYRVHATNYGWMDWTSNGETAGTTGLAYTAQAVQILVLPKGSAAPGDISRPYVGAGQTVKASGRDLNGKTQASAVGSNVSVGSASSGSPLSSFGIAVSNQIVTGSVLYRTSSPTAGFSSWTMGGGLSGASSAGLPINTLEMKLEGEMAAKYDLWYRVSLVGNGWLGWASNGASAGTDDALKGINAVQVVLVAKGGSTPGSTNGAFVSASGAATLVYQPHITNSGWLPFVTGGATAGTTGKALSLQALRVYVANAGVDGKVEMRVHVAEEGWQEWTSTPSFSGTTGKNHAIQAVQLRLTGALADSYDIYYRIHSAEYGWLGWAKNGAAAGTTGINRQAEAIEIVLKAKGEQGPSSSVPTLIELPTLSVQTNVRSRGWTNSVGRGGVSGTTGLGLAALGLKMSVSSGVEGGITYSVHAQDIGWQDWRSDGAEAGAVVQGKQIEAIKINLTGDLAKYYDVWYRVHAENYGWMGWAKNGASAGTSKISYQVEAVQVTITAKGAAAPGSTSRPYTESPMVSPVQSAMNRRAQGYSSATNWLLMVDYTNCAVGVFSGSRGNWSQRYFWPCTAGAYATPTVIGEFTVGSKGYVFGHGYSCYYYTQFYRDYLFHSIKYDQGTFNVQDGRLGVHASLGCVRLSLENAKWIYDNIPRGTKVVVYR